MVTVQYFLSTNKIKMLKTILVIMECLDVSMFTDTIVSLPSGLHLNAKDLDVCVMILHATFPWQM